MRRGGVDRSRGASLLETALVVPLLCALLFGVLELGTGWVAANRAGSAVGQAARIGAASGSRSTADRDVLLALRAALPHDQLAGLDRVVVFRAADPGGGPPAACLKPFGSTSDVGASGCNSYSGATVRAVSSTSMAGFGGTPGAADAYWPPASRKDTLSGPPDLLGLWIRTVHHSTTQLVLKDATIQTGAVYALEPDLGG